MALLSAELQHGVLFTRGSIACMCDVFTGGKRRKAVGLSPAGSHDNIKGSLHLQPAPHVHDAR